MSIAEFVSLGGITFLRSTTKATALRELVSAVSVAEEVRAKAILIHADAGAP